MKITEASARHAASRARNFLVGSYQSAHKFAQGLDRHMTLAKNIYSVLAPHIATIAPAFGEATQGSVVKAIGTYEGYRKRAMDLQSQGEQVHSQLSSIPNIRAP
jgi:hypothetical protein